ncbi:MAG TPA: hypothetical protein VGX37_07380, partial [Allosphingosinicella sp.]|nr:hypothetical protein [Allosphingosinicella sp.]
MSLRNALGNHASFEAIASGRGTAFLLSRSERGSLMRHIAACLMLLVAPIAAASQAPRDAMTKSNAQLPPPPVAEQRPYTFERHGV